MVQDDPLTNPTAFRMLVVAVTLETAALKFTHRMIMIESEQTAQQPRVTGARVIRVYEVAAPGDPYGEKWCTPVSPSAYPHTHGHELEKCHSRDV